MISLKVLNQDGESRAAFEGEKECFGAFYGEYQEGDSLLVQANLYPSEIRLRLDDTIGEAVLFLTNDFVFPVPAGQLKDRYHAAAFAGDRHYLYAGYADDAELGNYRDLALNPYDYHENETAFPHITANAETRGEAVFFAANTINGILANDHHGEWPFLTWGIDGRRDCEFTIDFGHPVSVKELVFYLRADFPHDDVWKTGRAEFSDGSIVPLSFEKTGDAQLFPVNKEYITWVRIFDLEPEESEEGFISLAAVKVNGRG